MQEQEHWKWNVVKRKHAHTNQRNHFRRLVWMLELYKRSASLVSQCRHDRVVNDPLRHERRSSHIIFFLCYTIFSSQWHNLPTLSLVFFGSWFYCLSQINILLHPPPGKMISSNHSRLRINRYIRQFKCRFIAYKPFWNEPYDFHARLSAYNLYYNPAGHYFTGSPPLCLSLMLCYTLATINQWHQTMSQTNVQHVIDSEVTASKPCRAAQQL